jgi:hypothetical protein
MIEVETIQSTTITVLIMIKAQAITSTGITTLITNVISLTLHVDQFSFVL